MKRHLPHPSVLLPTALIILALTREARAYVDPGTGSFLLQLAIGSLLGAAVAVKIFWRQIVAFLAGLLRRRPRGDSDER